MTPSMRILGLAALLVSTAVSAPVAGKRDLVVDTVTQTEVDIVATVTDWVTVGGAAAPTSSVVAAASAAQSAPAAATTPASDIPVTTSASGEKAQDGHPRGGPKASSTVASSFSTSVIASSAPAATSAAPAPVTSEPSAPSVTTSLIQAPPASSVSSVSSAPSASASAGAGSPQGTSGAKRGLAYEDASLTSLFDSYNMGWAYNWNSDVRGTLKSGMEFVPMLWGNSDTYTSVWDANVEKALASGSTHLMSFNEPDLSSQSNISPSQAAQDYQTYMNKYSSKAQLGAPAVTNGGGDMGLTWLSNFMSACGDACHIDFVNIHWYDSATNIDYFKQHLTDAHTQSGKPVWITEIGASGTDAEISAFLEEVIPWMDSQDFVQRYAYYMAAAGTLVDSDQTTLSTYGKTYATVGN